MPTPSGRGSAIASPAISNGPGSARRSRSPARIVRVEPTELALACDQGQLPIAHILAEAARRRDAQEGAR